MRECEPVKYAMSGCVPIILYKMYAVYTYRVDAVKQQRRFGNRM